MNLNFTIKKNYLTKLALALLLTLGLLPGIPSRASAQCVVHGADLGNYPGVTFPTTQPTTVGTSQFWGNTSSDQILMFIPIVPSGTYASNATLSTNIRLYMKRITSDNDPIMGFTDGNGTNFCGFLANDGMNHFKVDGTLSGGTTFTLTYTSLTSCNGSCGTNINDTYVVDLTLNISNQAVTTLDSTFQGSSIQGTSSTYTQTLDPSTGLRFMLGKQTGSENYQVDSVEFVCLVAPSITSTSANDTVCEGDSTALMVQSSGAGLSYQWQLNGQDISGATSSTLVLDSAVVADSGSYTCIVSNIVGSDTSSAILLDVNANPTVQISGPAAHCSGTTSTLNAQVSGGTPAYTYLWSPGGQTTQSISVSPTSNTQYGVWVTDNAGCSNGSATLDVVVNPSPIATAGPDETICEADDATLNGFATSGTPPFTYSWNPGSLSGATVTVSPTSTTVYALTVTDSNNCTSVDSVQVIVAPLPTVGFTYVDNIGSVSFTSTSTGAISWAWDFGDGNVSTLENPTNFYSVSGVYVVCLTGTSNMGCVNTFCDSVDVIVEGIEDGWAGASLSVFPNPSAGKISISFQSPAHASLDLQILDPMGKLLWQAHENHARELHKQVDLSHLSAGIYFLKISSADRQMVRRLVIGK
ncbi:MAG: T9SS type A sorting domain-containing protein [Bacteroidia bacterium]|nr:T9SS type A sorting domain-containing protein [Bacteroidia bacterium]